MFVGREQELASLEEFYAKDGIGMTVIYGRRRIGKSTLITEFVKDKKTVFYTATKIGKTRNLELFSKQVLDLFMPGIENISFNSIEAVFDFIDKNIANDKIVLVIDELPYWAEKDDSLLSILQKYIDTIWNDKNLKIILCGSACSIFIYIQNYNLLRRHLRKLSAKFRTNGTATSRNQYHLFLVIIISSFICYDQRFSEQ